MEFFIFSKHKYAYIFACWLANKETERKKRKKKKKKKFENYSELRKIFINKINNFNLQKRINGYRLQELNVQWDQYQ